MSAKDNETDEFHENEINPHYPLRVELRLTTMRKLAEYKRISGMGSAADTIAHMAGLAPLIAKEASNGSVIEVTRRNGNKQRLVCGIGNNA